MASASKREEMSVMAKNRNGGRKRCIKIAKSMSAVNDGRNDNQTSAASWQTSANGSIYGSNWRMASIIDKRESNEKRNIKAAAKASA